MASSAKLTAYITNSQDNATPYGMASVIPVDLGAGTPSDAILVGNGLGTNCIIVAGDGRTAFVTNEYPRGGTGSSLGSVTQIDLANGSLGWSSLVGIEPVDIEFVPQTKEPWAWVANFGDQTITTIRLSDGAIGDTLRTPNTGPNTVAFTPDGRLCYVANWGSDSAPGTTVTVFKVGKGGATGQAMRSIPVGNNPNWVAFAKDGATAYVANKGSSSVTPIDVATHTAGAEILMPGLPIQIEVSPDGTFAYVAIAGYNDAVVHLDITVSPAKIVRTIPLAKGCQPHWIAFTPDGSTAYVVGNGDGTLTPVDVATGKPGTPIHVASNTGADILDIAIVAGG